MADTNIDQAPAQSTIGVEAPPAEDEAHVFPPWGTGSEPSIPTVDTEDDHSIADSAIGGLSVASTTTSLRSSIYDHVEENGRTYHRFRQGKYLMPNDQQEQERLDIQHVLFDLTLGNLHLAPIGPNPQSVLDIGTGTGLWAIDFAEQYPLARVLGIDLSAIQPIQVPKNCRFEIDDAEDNWIFDEQFDYIHARMLLSCFKDPCSVFQKAYDSLAPGGYLEMQDFVYPPQFMGQPPTESSLYKWGQILCEGSVKLGRPWNNVPKYKQWFGEIGFEEVVEKKYYWPLNAWAKGDYYKQISVYAQADLLNGLDGMSLKVMGLIGWSVDEIKKFLVKVKEDVKNNAIHSYGPIRVVYGRKPSVGS